MKATAIIGIVISAIAFLVICAATTNLIVEGMGGLGWGIIASVYLLVFCIVELSSGKKEETK